MATSRLYLDTRHVKKDGTCSLKIAISNHGKTSYLPLHISINPEREWDEKRKMIVRHSDALRLNVHIKRIILLIENMYLELTEMQRIKRLSAVELRDLISGKTDPKKSKDTYHILEHLQFFSRTCQIDFLVLGQEV